MIAIGSDHVGVELKSIIIEYLKEQSHHCQDFGCFEKKRIDYPDIAFQVCDSIKKGNAERGILICGTGVGMAICANKFSGIRAVVCSEPYSARLSVEHNDTNVLALGARVVGEELAKMIIDSWMTTRFEGGRHQKRIDKISKIENDPSL